MSHTESLASDIISHIATSDADSFEPLALRVFAHQFAGNRPYRLFCEGRDATPLSVNYWQDIPAAPAAAFKRFALTCADPSLCVPEKGGRTFHSSGTSGAETSKHYMDAFSIAVYTASLKRSYDHFVNVGSDPSPILAFMPSAEDAPHSSLSFMLGELIRRDGGAFFWGEGWESRAGNELSLLAESRVLFGTAFAWVNLLDYIAENAVNAGVPAGTRVVETGGFKGRSREISREELYATFVRRLGVDPEHCIAEYGMSEMASQFYDTAYRDFINGTERPARKSGLPHMVRTRVINPLTGESAEEGQPGVLAHYDVTNLNSCLAIQTEDWGYALPDGGGFVLLGRAPGAALRGCSLTAEEFQSRQ